MPEVQSRLYFLTPTRSDLSNPLFIFLPGMDGTGKLLRVQTAGLEATFDVRCLAIPPDDLTGWDQLTKGVLSLIRAELEKVPHRSVYLCGESFGGCLAIKVALRAPQLFERIILVNPASSYNRRPWIHEGCQLSQWLPQVLYRFASITLLPFLASTERIEPDAFEALLEVVRVVPQKTSVWRLSLLRQFEVDQTQLRSLSQPVLIIASQGDRLLPSVAEAHRLVGVLPNAQTVTLPKSGHACLLEKDVNLSEIIKAENFSAGPHTATEGATSSDR